MVPFQVFQCVRTELVWQRQHNSAVRGSGIDLHLRLIDGTLNPIPRDRQARRNVFESAGEIASRSRLHLHVAYVRSRGPWGGVQLLKECIRELMARTDTGRGGDGRRRGCSAATGGLLRREDSERRNKLQDRPPERAQPITAGGTGATLRGATRQSSAKRPHAASPCEGGRVRTTYCIRPGDGATGFRHESISRRKMKQKF